MVIAIIQCRLGSTRFHRKALADLYGKPVIAHVVERALQIRGVDRVIVATPWGDAPVIAQALSGVVCEECGGRGAVLDAPQDALDGRAYWEKCPTCDGGDRLSVFHARVDDDDVLGRFVAALENYPECDTVMRITGDCPLIQPKVCERVLSLYKASHVEYAWTDTHNDVWQDGLDCEVFSRALLQRANSEAQWDGEREHVTPLMREMCWDGPHDIATLRGDPAFADWPKVSIDTTDDLERVRAWMERH